MSVDGRRIVSFDTSAINQLADDQDSYALIAGLTAGYFVRFPFTAVSEIIATSSGERRKRLLTVCRKLLAAGDCVEPHHGDCENHGQPFREGRAASTLNATRFVH